jgi:transketolase C-terminal domain/subunit
MRTQLDLTVVVPTASAQAPAAVRATYELSGRIYFRIARQGTPIPGLKGSFPVGKARVIGEGLDVALIAVGSIAREEQRAAEIRVKDDTAAAVALASTLKLRRVEDLAELLENVALAISVETHPPQWRARLAGRRADQSLPCRLTRAGMDVVPRGRGSSQRFFLEDRSGLSAERLASMAQVALEAASA